MNKDIAHGVAQGLELNYISNSHRSEAILTFPLAVKALGVSGDARLPGRCVLAFVWVKWPRIGQPAGVLTRRTDPRARKPRAHM